MKPERLAGRLSALKQAGYAAARRWAGLGGASSGGRDQVVETLLRLDSPWVVDIRLHKLPAWLRQFNHMSYGLKMGKDGFLYLGVGDNVQDGHLFRVDTGSGEMTDLGSFMQALPEDARKQGNHGKFHVGPHQANDGSIYFASHPREYWDGSQGARLFRHRAAEGITDLGPTPRNQGAYYLYGDDQYQQLYLTTEDAHFVIYDIATGTWRDKGEFSKRPSMTGLTDRQGRHYVYSHYGKMGYSPGCETITRYDPAKDLLETSAMAPPSLWVGAVSPDQDLAYTTDYLFADVFRWRLSDWPHHRYESFGRIDPDGRAVFSNNLSLTPDASGLVIAGTIDSRDNRFRGNLHGVWVYDIEAGNKYLAACLNDALTQFFGSDAGNLSIYWTNANTVDDQGWICVGFHTLPSRPSSEAGLLLVRVRHENGRSGGSPAEHPPAQP